MRQQDVIKRPIALTEKATRLKADNKVVFEVALEANKAQIRSAVEHLYNVKVVDVRTCNRRGKPRRVRYNQWGTTKHWKKAVVVLHPDYHIDLF